MGLPVPFGFVITTKACGRFFAGGRALDAQIIEEMRTKIREVEEVTGKEFGGRGKPAACFSAHKQRDKDTYHDRYGVQSRSQRQDCSGTGELERHGICSRLLHQVSQDLRLAGEEDTSEPFHRRI